MADACILLRAYQQNELLHVILADKYFIYYAYMQRLLATAAVYLVHMQLCTLQGNYNNIQHDIQYIVTTNLRTREETVASFLRESSLPLHCLSTKHLGGQFLNIFHSTWQTCSMLNRIYLLLSLAQLGLYFIL